MKQTPNRDAFVRILKLQIEAWRERQDTLAANDPDFEYFELTSLIEKTTTFLREEFDE